jgi:hypothetical protein
MPPNVAMSRMLWSQSYYGEQGSSVLAKLCLLRMACNNLAGYVLPKSVTFFQYASEKKYIAFKIE